MGYAEKRDGYYLARFKAGDGRYPTVKDGHGTAIRYRTEREAKRAANDEEAKVRDGRWRDPAKGQVLVSDWANQWYASLDLAPSTMQNIRRHLEEHILPAFEDKELGELDAALIEGWIRREHAAGYKPSSVRTWRGTLHTMLADAVEQGLIDSNRASRRRGRGRRTGRSRERGPEKVTISDLGALLLAERAALLSGRDDEFVLVTLIHYTGMRWGEAIGLETKYARLGSIRVEWQLYELDTGELLKCPPKEDSYRDIDLPDWLSKLLSGHIARTGPQRCPCHGDVYVFSGPRPARGSRTATIADVAKRANVAVGTVSAVLNQPDKVRELTRARVQAAIADLGFVPGRKQIAKGWHWERSAFSGRIFQPAATGWYPKKAPYPARPVPLIATPWPGIAQHGRGAQGRAEFAWLPLAPGLTPHGLRHSHKTAMVEQRTPEVLSHERLGHLLGGVGARYTHVTPAMRQELLEHLTERWEDALDARLAMSARSPVGVLDELLQARSRQAEVGRSEDRPTIFPRSKVRPLRAKTRNRA